MYAEEGIEVADAYVRRHLDICEFCRAEVEFYVLYPPVEEEVSPNPGPMPLPLYDLAAALLDARTNLRAFYKLVGG